VLVRVHPDDLPLVAEGAGEALQARGARLQADPHVQRGGCSVESDAGTIDATIENRWARAAQAMGHALPWKPVDRVTGTQDDSSPRPLGLETSDGEA
jgi:flagellar assembly protein FliH